MHPDITIELIILQPFNSTERITGLIKQAEEKSNLLLEREGRTPEAWEYTEHNCIVTYYYFRECDMEI